MEGTPPPIHRSHKIVISICAVILLGLLGYGGYRYWGLLNQNISLGSKIGELEASLSLSQNQKSDLENKLTTAEQINNSFVNQISGISSTVGSLKKLSQTDPELLKKYSKVYFLNENYVPASLSDIDIEYLFLKSKPQQVLTQVWPHLKTLLVAAKGVALHLEVISAYRSFGDQNGVKTSYKITYGAGSANQFSADQGYSEHQLGTAIDFTTPGVADTFSGFSKTDEYKWLTMNAWQYGFVESYPPSNTYYVFEPWHWRYVGVQLATKLHQSGKYFYDMDQREIDTYLVNFFD
jgi:D-alanyl-D-alanine carboxypeptidase